MYDQNLRNDGDNKANPPWEKKLSQFFILFLRSILIIV